MTLRDASPELIADYMENGRRSLDDTRIKLNKHVLRLLGDSELGTMTRKSLVAYRRQRLAEGAANSSVNSEMSIVRSIHVVNDVNPPITPWLEVRNARTTWVTRTELAAVLARLKPPYCWAYDFSWRTGWRLRSEVLKIRKEYVLPGEGIELPKGLTKNSDGRFFPIEPIADLVDAAMKWAPHASSPWLFNHRQGKPIGEFYHRLRTAFRKAGLEYKIPHDCRRAATRRLHEDGIRDDLARELIGHRDLRVHERYNIKVRRDLRQLGTVLAKPHGGGENNGGAPAAA